MLGKGPVEVETASGESGQMPQVVDTTPETGAPKRPPVRRRALTCLFVGVIFLALLVSFLDFAQRVGSISMPGDPRADAIVVLTGGTERVERAVSLLSEGRAMRLLISGVHPGTTRKQIASITSADMPLFDCCVDLDRLALNTAGNATETAVWAQSHAFRSLLVVTSAYHLPRAQAELAEALPDVDLVAYPVYPSGLDLKAWYLSPKTIHLLMREYVKYTLARFRIVATHLTSF
ncbi:YdcF family protein [Roseibium polysiphoniae]|uniref:YdcF family protein n=1 Tax=Roseibium polysiphoniae TaxID=2571221 RepID=UPI003296F648